MKKRSYRGFYYIIGYMMLLRVVLHITTGISVFNLGILFDLVLITFWIGAIAYFLKSIIAQRIFYTFVVIVSTIFTVGDSLYYEYFGIISSKTSFAGLKFLAAGQTLEYDITIPLVAYLITPILIATIYLIISNKKPDVFVLKDFGIFSIFFVIQVGIFMFWGSYNYDSNIDYYRSDAYLFESMHDRALFSEKYGYYNYHILDFTRINHEQSIEEQVAEIDAFYDSLETHQTNDKSDVYSGYNVISIIGESLDTRFIDETLTPNLYQMKTEGLTFDNYYTPVFQQGATCNSEFMGLTGLMAIRSNDWSNNVCDAYSDNDFPYSMPYQLSSIGYDTYYFHSGYEWFYNREEMIPSYGFETVKFQEDMYELGYDDFVDRYDTDMINFFDEFVDYDELFYVNLLTYSGHGAYNQEDFDIYLDRVNEAYPDNDLDYGIVNYMEKLVELDEMIGLVRQRLSDNGQLDNTLFVVYPDHFPYMLDADLYTEHIGIELDDPEIKRQDLIVYAPNMIAETIVMPGSTVDIAPTILNMIDSSLNFDHFLGVDLFGVEENYVIFSDLMITDGYTYLDISENYYGPLVDSVMFDIALEHKITILEIQKKIFQTDYFRR